MDLIRDLLLRIEAMPMRAGEAYLLESNRPPLAAPGDDPDSIYYNMKLLRGAGYLALTPTQPALGFGLTGLTWQGHEFLDAVRDPEIWRKTKEGASKAGGFTVGLLADLAKGFVRTQIQKHTGVEL